MAVEDACQLVKCLDLAILKKNGENSDFFAPGKPSLEEADALWPLALQLYDSWPLQWRPFFFLIFSRASGFIYMCNNPIANAIVGVVLLNRFFLAVVVSFMSFLLFKSARDLRTWSKIRVASYRL
jgi:hypothetical protein